MYKYKQGLATMTIVGIVALIIVIGGGVYVATQNEARVDVDTEEDKQAMEDERGDTTEQETRDDRGEGIDLSGDLSLREVFSLGNNLRCSFSQTDGEVTSEGVVYISDAGERIRGDFEITGGAEAGMESHFIREGDIGYFWSSQAEQGMRMSMIGQTDFPESEGQAQSYNAVDLDARVSYDCDRWNVEANRFEPPASVEFLDMEAMMESMIDVESGIDLY